MGLDCVSLHNITEGRNEKERVGDGCNEDFVLPSFSNGMESLVGRVKLLDKDVIMAVA